MHKSRALSVGAGTASTNSRLQRPSTGGSASGVSARTSRSTAAQSKTPASAPPIRKRVSTATSKRPAAQRAQPVDNQTERVEEPEQVTEIGSVRSNNSDGGAAWFVGNDYRLITAVRVRPMLAAEKKRGLRRIVDMAGPDEGGWTRLINPVALTSPLSPANDSEAAPQLPSNQFTHEFAFDYSFWSYDHAPGRRVATQSVVYESLGGFAIETVLQGSNCAILAYGQSGTGKTFTMMGSEKAAPATGATGAAKTSQRAVRPVTSVPTRRASATAAAGAESSRRGLTPRICRGLFDRIEELQQEFGAKSAVHVGYVEIYNERVYDLVPAPTTNSKVCCLARCLPCQKRKI